MNLQLNPEYCLGQEVIVPCGSNGLTRGIVIAILHRGHYERFQTTTLIQSPRYLEGTPPSTINQPDGIHYWVTTTTQWMPEATIRVNP